MKRVSSIVLIVLFAIMAAGCGRVEPGHVGIKVNLTGGDRGVDDITIVTGRYTYNPWSSQVIEWPTHVQRFAWTKNPHEGSPNDESFDCSSAKGQLVNLDIAAAVEFDSVKVPALYVEYRKDAPSLVDGFIRDRIRHYLNEQCSTRDVASIYGEGKVDLLKSVEEAVQEELGPKGILVSELSFLGKPRLPESVQASIDRVIEQRNAALEAEEKVKQREAEARQKVAEAQGEVEKTLMLAEAKSKANRIEAESLTPLLVQARAIESWNGTLPQVTGNGAVPFIQMEKSTRQ